MYFDLTRQRLVRTVGRNGGWKDTEQCCRSENNAGNGDSNRSKKKHINEKVIVVTKASNTDTEEA